ncbi:hypothetical protein [Streptomyces sp. NPDC054787]
MATQSTPTTRLDEAPGRLSRERRELAQDIARHVVIDLAPLEERHFEQRARAHFRRRLPWRGHRTTRFDPWGLPSELLTPTALAVATALLGAVSTEVVGSLRQRTRSRLRWRGQRRAQAPAAVTPPQVPPTPAELVRLHASALAGARATPRVSEELARRIADAALAHLVHSLAATAAPAATEGAVPDALPPNRSDPPSPPDDHEPPSADR